MLLFHPDDLEMILHVDVVLEVLVAHPDPVFVTEAYTRISIGF